MPAKKRGPGRPQGLNFPDRIYLRLPTGMLGELERAASRREMTVVALVRALLREGLTREARRR
jgi:hypothetical protein